MNIFNRIIYFVLVITALFSTQMQGMDRSEALIYAAELGDIDKVTTLVEAVSEQQRKSFVNQQGEYGDGLTALHKAAAFNHADIVTYLLSVGADVDCKSYNEDTPLHYAAFKGGARTIRILLDAKANCEVVDLDGYTPLSLAICNTDVDADERGLMRGLIKQHMIQNRSHSMAKKFGAVIARSNQARLGADSPLGLLPQHLLGEIASLAAKDKIQEQVQEEERNIVLEFPVTFPPAKSLKYFLNQMVGSHYERKREIISLSATVAVGAICAIGALAAVAAVTFVGARLMPWVLPKR